MELALDDRHVTVRQPSEGWPRDALILQAECGVNAEDIEVVDDIFETFDIHGRPTRAQALAAREIGELAQAALDAGGAISFLLGLSLTVGTLAAGEVPNEFVADSASDKDLLRQLGTARPRLPLTPQNATEVFVPRVDADLVAALARRGAVRVYADAMRVETPAARYRELWRTLEFAFKAHGETLIRRIARFAPAIDLGFDIDELRRLLRIRDQASHAVARAGASSLAETDQRVLEHLGRLWGLVDRVVLTKRESDSGLEVDELLPLAAYIDQDGITQVLVDEDPEQWILKSGSARFFGGA